MLHRMIFTVLALDLLVSIGAAQACYAENGGNAFDPATSMGGPNLLLGIRFTAPSGITASGVEVFTGIGSGTNTIGIWSHNAGSNQPGTNLGTGSWSMTGAPNWQGATLPTPIALTAGATYWIVWGPQNGAQASVEPVTSTASIQPYRGSFNAGASWSGPFQSLAWKFRIICNVVAWQTNQACSGMTADGVLSNGFTPAITSVPAGQTVTIAFSGLAGAPWDVAYTVNTPMLPLGLTTANGQIFNLDLNHLSFNLLFGGAFQNAFVPGSIPAAFTNQGTFIGAQTIMLTPSMPDGFCLSQASGLQIL